MSTNITMNKVNSMRTYVNGLREKSMTNITKYSSAARKIMLGFSMLLVSVCSSAVDLQDISFNSLPGGKFQIKMDFDGVPPEATGYNIERPARIALDLSGVTSSLAKKKHSLAYGNAQSVTVLEAGDRTRVVINLQELASYTTSIEGNSMLVVIGNDSVKSLYADSSSSLEQQFQTSEQQVKVTNVDFQRGADGEGNLILELSDDKVDVDVGIEGNQIKVNILNVGVAENLQRTYDVLDFATASF